VYDLHEVYEVYEVHEVYEVVCKRKSVQNDWFEGL
jgi:hypothetical protein